MGMTRERVEEYHRLLPGENEQSNEGKSRKAVEGFFGYIEDSSGSKGNLEYT